MSDKTIFALASGRPPAAIALIRISGGHAHAAAQQLAGRLPPVRQAALRCLRHPTTAERLDDGLVLRFDAPASATGEDLVELHCHGGRAVVDALLDALGTLEGLRLAMPGEFTRRAFENGRIDLTEAEGLADLLEAETQSQRRAALLLAEGGLRRAVEQWQQRVLLLAARAEAAIDYADEEEVGPDPVLARDCSALAVELAEWLERPRVEPLKEGVRVVAAGPPNAGKSSLINALSQQDKAIVTDIPGTTRDHIEVPLAVEGLPILLTDTAGLRESADPVERIGVARTRSLLERADILLWLGEVEQAPSHPRTIFVHNKADLRGRELAPDAAIATSCVSGRGIGELLRTVGALARTLLPEEGVVALNRRQSELLGDARSALVAAAGAGDLVLVAEELRSARTAFDRLTGRAGVEDLLDALFGRFCLGK